MAAFQAAAPGDGAATACLSRLRDMALSPANAPAALALLCEEQLLAASGIWPRGEAWLGAHCIFLCAFISTVTTRVRRLCCQRMRRKDLGLEPWLSLEQAQSGRRCLGTQGHRCRG